MKSVDNSYDDIAACIKSMIESQPLWDDQQLTVEIASKYGVFTAKKYLPVLPIFRQMVASSSISAVPFNASGSEVLGLYNSINGF